MASKTITLTQTRPNLDVDFHTGSEEFKTFKSEAITFSLTGDGFATSIRFKFRSVLSKLLDFFARSRAEITENIF